ncbi:hypothetical protein K502DRAFT_64842 [Neoconidiobolus thromboides FSU 785]|nr:hypothetical protein K502DRAFT_64842 [Neoconidiobolus thromboides FSU 785]
MNETYRRSYFIFLFILYVFLNVQMMNNTPSERDNDLHKKRINFINGTITNSTFDSTDFGLPEGLKKFQKVIFDEELIKNSEGKFYHGLNVSFKADWNKQLVEKIDMKRTLPKTEEDPNNNNTDTSKWRQGMNASDTGYFNFQLRSKPTKFDKHLTKDIKFLQGYINVYTDIAQSNSYTFLMEGFHFLKNGSAYLHGYSSINNYNPINVMKLLPDEDTFNTVKKFYNESYIDRISVYEDIGQDFFESSNSTCYLEMLLQIKPFDKKYSLDQISSLEQELKDPKGLPTIPSIPVHTNFFMYSPNCPEIVLTSYDTKGIKTELVTNKQTNYALMVTALGLFSTLLYISQIEYTSTASMISKLSWWSFVFFTIIDGYFCLTHLTGAVLFRPVRGLFLAAAFFYFIQVAFFELRYLQMILKIQRPESSRLRQHQEAGYLNIHFYIFILIGMFIVYQTLTSRGVFQQTILRCFCFFMYSFWLPQIWRNLKRGTSKGLSLSFILGISLFKLAIPLYLFACPNNLLEIKDATETNYSWVYYLTFYVIVQIIILLSQDIFGPRWFTPSFIFPPTYNYHPLSSAAPPLDEEAPIDPLESDCTICMLPLFPENSESDFKNSKGATSNPNDPLLSTNNLNVNTTATSALNRFTSSRGIMVAPCFHRFHTPCLEQWMRIKLECPVCRAQLPPI